MSVYQVMQENWRFPRETPHGKRQKVGITWETGKGEPPRAAPGVPASRSVPQAGLATKTGISRSVLVWYVA